MTKPLACLLHVYYPHLWADLAGALHALSAVDLRVHVNVVETAASPKLLSRIRAAVPDARIVISPNRGRDIGGFFRLMEDFDFNAHDVVCLMHTKRSPHMLFWRGRRWRRSLLAAMAKDRARVLENVALFRDEPDVGLIGAKAFRDTTIARNAPLYTAFLDRLAVAPANRDCEFVAGTMMLLRARVLARLYHGLRGFEFSDSDRISRLQHLDGDAPHAIERIIGNLVRDEGLRFVWRD